MKSRDALVLSLIAGVLIGIIVGAYQKFVPYHGDDLFFPVCAAKTIYSGIDPYAGDCKIIVDEHVYPTNPMTTIWAALPFAWLGDNLAPIAMWSVINMIMFYGIFRTGRTYLLWMMLSPVYLMAFNHLQWSPLFVGIALVPDFLPLSLVKPQSAIAVILTNLNKKRFLGLVIFGVLTLIFDPTWPLRWIGQALVYDGFIPFLILPVGPLLLLSLLRWKDKDAWFLFLMSLSPQRWFYDQLPLWTLVNCKRQALLLVGLSWIGYIASRWTTADYRLMINLTLYIPVLCMELYPFVREKIEHQSHAPALKC